MKQIKNMLVRVADRLYYFLVINKLMEISCFSLELSNIINLDNLDNKIENFRRSGVDQFIF